MRRSPRHRVAYLASLVVLVGAALLATPPVATAATTDFEAEVDAKMRRPDGFCANGAFRCGDALVTGFGPAQWSFTIDSFQPISDSCGDYTATVTFTLQDQSKLTLAEAGTVCGPGTSFFPTPTSSWGNPDRVSGTWDVQGATGQFAGMTGSGTDTGKSAGAHVTVSYVGTLES